MIESASISPEFLLSKRWFRGKARTIENVEIKDVLPMPGTQFSILLIGVNFDEGGHETYLLTKRGDGTEDEISEALTEPEFRDHLLAAIACNARLNGRAGDLIASRTNAFPHGCGDSDLKCDSSLSRAEQSNTSIIYGDQFILKLFRKIEPGVNPDIEIGMFLTEHDFKHTPAVLGKLEYRERERQTVYAAGILQQFVRNQGDAWKYTLEQLSVFFNQALRSMQDHPPTLNSDHPLDLMDEQMPPDARELIGSYINSAHLLGTRTAQMHGTLANSADPDFAPEQFTREDGQKLYQEMLGQADITFELLRRKQGVLAHDAAEDARKLLRIENRVMERFSALRDDPISVQRIRYHGDFHLGQVLYTGDDFMIIDFEGEPARPLSERRGKTIAMRDVAGMIRSFQYAAYTALVGQLSGIAAEAEIRSKVESWAAFWNAWVSATYLKGYFSAAAKLPFVPAEAQEQRSLLDAFLLQKALYEVAYELNNRPDWVRIPLRGILSLMD